MVLYHVVLFVGCNCFPFKFQQYNHKHNTLSTFSPSVRSIKSVCKVGSSPVFRHINRTLNILWLSTTPHRGYIKNNFGNLPDSSTTPKTASLSTPQLVSKIAVFSCETHQTWCEKSGDIAPRQTIMVDGSDVVSRRAVWTNAAITKLDKLFENRFMTSHLHIN